MMTKSQKLCSPKSNIEGIIISLEKYKKHKDYITITIS